MSFTIDKDVHAHAVVPRVSCIAKRVPNIQCGCTLAFTYVRTSRARQEVTNWQGFPGQHRFP